MVIEEHKIIIIIIEGEEGEAIKVVGLCTYLTHINDTSTVYSQFDQNWSDEVFRVVGVDTKSYPTMYIIEDENGNVVDGKFYKA